MPHLNRNVHHIFHFHEIGKIQKFLSNCSFFTAYIFICINALWQCKSVALDTSGWKYYICWAGSVTLARICKRNDIYVWISGYKCLCVTIHVNPPVQSPTILKWMPNVSLLSVGHCKVKSHNETLKLWIVGQLERMRNHINMQLTLKNKVCTQMHNPQWIYTT